MKSIASMLMNLLIGIYITVLQLFSSTAPLISPRSFWTIGISVVAFSLVSIPDDYSRTQILKQVQLGLGVLIFAAAALSRHIPITQVGVIETLFGMCLLICSTLSLGMVFQTNASRADVSVSQWKP
ncbi:hypothetical protein JZ785_04740 [Alicyclobacillus curvatus]|nr:hypothetical protein JZ785_04740 [Alicyclobacillus curvatus]